MCLTQVGRIPFPHFQPSSLWGNKNWAPQYKDVEVGKFKEQNWLNRLQMVQFDCPLVSLTFEVKFAEFPEKMEGLRALKYITIQTFPT